MWALYLGGLSLVRAVLGAARGRTVKSLPPLAHDEPGVGALDVTGRADDHTPVERV
jgi:hypothetical protein